MSSKDIIPIFSLLVARELIQKGFQIVDLKPNKKNEVHNRDGSLHKRLDTVVYYFINSEDLQKELAVINKKLFGNNHNSLEKQLNIQAAPKKE